MALSDVRSLVVGLSGRQDLNSSPYTMLDAFINKGQALLDRLLSSKGKGRFFVDISEGDIFKYFKYSRAISEVWVADADGRTKLTKVDLSDLKEEYSTNKSEITSGRPTYYSLAIVRPIVSGSTPEVVTPSNFSQSWMLDDVVSSSWYTYGGIIWMPPADGTYTMEIVGLFSSIPLSSTVTSSYWTENDPLLLAYAALYYMEVSYRNTEGARDWMNAILTDIGEMEKDVVENTIVDVDSMLG